MKITAYTTLALIAFILIATAAIAQKLPALQEVSLREPAGRKIDGKATEWGNKFQAYNKKNLLSYIIANDDNNLYLTVYTPDALTINKISQGGVTFTVSSILDKKLREKANNAEVRYPYFDLAGKESGAGMASRAREFHNFKKDSLIHKTGLDSLVSLSNLKIAALCKEIRVLGIKAITDTVISIYNTDGIKAAGSFDKNMGYTYELAIPLKHLNLSATEGTKFSYNIKLSGTPTAEDYVKANRSPPRPNNARPGSRFFDESLYLGTPTDFWGEYTLAK
jgi:hypothetical protein